MDMGIYHEMKGEIEDGTMSKMIPETMVMKCGLLDQIETMVLLIPKCWIESDVIPEVLGFVLIFVFS